MNRLIYIKSYLVQAATAQFVAAYDYERRSSVEESFGNSGAMLYVHNSMLYARKALLHARNSMLHDYNAIGCPINPISPISPISPIRPMRPIRPISASQYIKSRRWFARKINYLYDEIISRK